MGSFWPRDWTHISCIAGRFFTSHLGSPVEWWWVYIKGLVVPGKWVLNEDTYGARGPLSQALRPENTLMSTQVPHGKGWQGWNIPDTHDSKSNIYIKIYIDNVLKSLHQKYSASLKGSCLRHSWVQPICNLKGILLKAGTLEPLSPPGCHRAMGDKHSSLWERGCRDYCLYCTEGEPEDQRSQHDLDKVTQRARGRPNRTQMSWLSWWALFLNTHGASWGPKLKSLHSI